MSEIELSILKKHFGQPWSWSLTQIETGYTLAAKYGDAPPQSICLSRGGTKIYKTIDAALKDIAQVQLDPVIYFELTEQRNPHNS